MNNERHIVMVPTSRVKDNVMWKHKDGSELHLGNEGIVGAWEDGFIECQHLQIISNEEIKEGDWHMLGNTITKADKEDIELINTHPHLKENCKKITGTTDPMLITDGIREIDRFLIVDFIKKYNKAK